MSNASQPLWVFGNALWAMEHAINLPSINELIIWWVYMQVFTHLKCRQGEVLSTSPSLF